VIAVENLWRAMAFMSIIKAMECFLKGRRRMKKGCFIAVWAVAGVLLGGCTKPPPKVVAVAPPGCQVLNLDGLSDRDIERVKALLAKLEPLIERRRAQQNLATLTFQELYAPLPPDDRKLLARFQNLKAVELNVKIPYQGMAAGNEDLVKITGRKVAGKGKPRELPPQFLPRDVYRQYDVMMAAMHKDLGRRLYVESGYRSSAYQLYLVLFYLKNHKYSIRETVKFVALPGYSEHGSPRRQAIDFINEKGINGEDNPREFEELPEFAWLVKNARRFGFVLSYPKNSPTGITYEPWHWHYEPAGVYKRN
jgi:LAS superfamily LD-carboxypeptidase LdcB